MALLIGWYFLIEVCPLVCLWSHSKWKPWKMLQWCNWWQKWSCNRACQFVQLVWEIVSCRRMLCNSMQKHKLPYQLFESTDNMKLNSEIWTLEFQSNYFVFTFVGKFSTRQTCDSGTTPADAIKTTSPKQATGTHANWDKSYPIWLKYKKHDKPICPTMHPRSDTIKNAFRPNLSANFVVHRFPKIKTTLSAIDDLYGSNVVPVRSKM